MEFVGSSIKGGTIQGGALLWCSANARLAGLELSFGFQLSRAVQIAGRFVLREPLNSQLYRRLLHWWFDRLLIHGKWPHSFSLIC